MVAGYVHIEVETVQSPKQPDWPCGDVVACDRNVSATTIVCADGIGSGIRARIAAELCASRTLELLRLGTSLRKAFASVVHSMERNRDPSGAYAAFSVARILNDGMTTILAYEAPPPILVNHLHAIPIPIRSVELGGTLVAESDCYLEPGDGLLLTSDGITQAGLGHGLSQGWQTDGVVRYIDGCLTDGYSLKEIVQQIHKKARNLWQEAGDDCTVIMALCRRGQIVNVLTGPPASEKADAAVVRRFVQSDGLKIVCGGTTADVVARALGEHVDVEQDPQSLVAPPRYQIEGIDLVTEGAVTLNQVYNLLDENLAEFKEDSGVTELCALLQIADRVNIIIGDAKNRASGDISFRQQGILTRERIMPLIAEKLRAAGKLVVVEHA
jgi:hypothetical protein